MPIRRIGLFVNRIDTAFQREMCIALSDLANKAGQHLLVFNSNSSAERENAYEDLENRIFDLAPIEQMDAVIVMPDTYGIAAHRQELLRQVRLRARPGVPLVSVRAAEEGFLQVLTNEDNAIEDVLKHLLTVHGCRHVSLMGGPVDQSDAVRREMCFRRVMAENDLTVDEHSIFHGDFWKRTSSQAADFFLADPRGLPEAIVCANDYMAIALCNELFSRGLRVPQDVLVTGYDNIPETSSYTPAMTTVTIDCAEMARQAYGLIEQVWCGEEPTRRVFVAPLATIRESCGCSMENTHAGAKEKKNLFVRMDSLTNAIVWQASYAVELAGATELGDIQRQIMRSVVHFGPWRHVYLGLCARDGADMAEMTYESKLSKKMRLCMRVVNGEARPLPSRLMARCDLLPEADWDDEAKTIYFSLLHNHEHIFGYIGIGFEPRYTYDVEYFNWLVLTATALSDLINRQRLQRALERNERMSVTDPLTGLLNRRGFEQFSRKQRAAAGREKHYAVLVGVDMDGLKRINDHYGHQEGDRAIQMMADALKAAYGSEGIISRIGGDEFWALLFCDGTHTEEEYRQRYYECLRRENEKEARPYIVYASAGVYRSRIESGEDLDELMRRCDQQLYKEKTLHHARRRNAEG